MFDPRDFLPQLPWEGPPIPRGLVYRAAYKRLRPPGWEPRKPYPHELRHGLEPEQMMYLVNEVRKRYINDWPTPSKDLLKRYAIRYAESDLWLALTDAEADEIAEMAMRERGYARP